MATIKDIAIRAGVSHGTASNVLNKRGNVSAEKIRLVETAAKELGYTINAQAQSLRGASSNKVAFIVPDLETERYNDLFSGLVLACESLNLDIDIYITNNQAYNEIAIIDRAVSSNPYAIITVSCLYKNKNNYKAHIPTIFIERHIKAMSDNSCFLSFDFEMATKKLLDQCILEKNRKTAILMSDAPYSYNKVIERTIVDCYDKDDIDYELIKVNNVQAFDMILTIFNETNYYDSIICCEDEYTKYLNTARTLVRNTGISNIYSLGSQRIEGKHSIKKYQLNYRSLGRDLQKILSTIRQHKIERSDDQIKPASGFSFKYATVQTVATKRLRMLALRSPSINSIKQLTSNLLHETGINLEINDLPYEMLYDYIRTHNIDNYDMVRIDMAWIDELAKDKLLDISDCDFSQFRSQLGNSNNPEYTMYQNRQYAIPFDPSVQLLFYRKDLLENALIKREFYEQYKKQLTVPQNFTDYNQILEFFNRSKNSHSPVKYGSSLVYGLNLTAAHDFFPRLYDFKADYIQNNHLTLDPTALKKALLNYHAAYQLASPDINSWWEGGIDAFATGDTAMGIYFSNYASSILKNPNCKVHEKIGFSQVPGGKPLLGGGVLSISKNTSHLAQCLDFINWVYSDKIASLITLLGGYIDHQAVAENIEICKLYPWINYVSGAIGAGRRRHKSSNHHPIRFELIVGQLVKDSINDLDHIDQYITTALEEISDS